MSITPDQIRELDKYQDKFLKGEITTQEYEFAKSEILGGRSKQPQKVHKISANESSDNKDDDPMIGNVIYAIVAFIFLSIKSIFIGLYLGIYHLHQRIIGVSKSHNVSLWKVYGSIGLPVGIVCLSILGVSAYSSHQTQLAEQAISDRKVAEEKVLQDKKKADIKAEQEKVEKEKANTPKPNIEIQSSQASQGKKTTYTLKFTASGADTITMNGESLPINGSGVYEKEIPLKNIETAISLTAKNKYYSTENGFLIKRDKNSEDIAREKKKQEDEEYQKRAQAILEKREWAKTNYYAIAKTCEKRVLEVLISPKSAEFPSPSAENIRFNDDKIRYNGYVDSQNAYGALLRSNYRCDVERYSEDGEEYVRTSVELY